MLGIIFNIGRTNEFACLRFLLYLLFRTIVEVGPVTVTSNAKKAIDAVNKLTANGGGDCPELGMTGLYQALLHCLPRSNLYYFSDADVKDKARKNEVMLLAKEKKVKINFILTGKCSRRKRRHFQRSAVLRDSHLSKRVSKRSVEGQALYQELATETGGQVLETSKGGVAEVVKVINPGSSTNSSVGLKEVELMNVKESRAQYFSGHSYLVDIDNTLESLVVSLTAADSPSLVIKTVVKGIYEKPNKNGGKEVLPKARTCQTFQN